MRCKAHLILAGFAYGWGVPRVQWLICWTVISQSVSLNSSHTIAFIFGLIPLGKAWIPFILTSYVLNSTTTILQGWLWHWYAVKKKKPTLNLTTMAWTAIGDRFLLVTLLLIIHVGGSKEVHCLRALPYFSKSALHVLLV